MPCGRASPFRRVVCHNASLLIKLNSWLIASWQVELRLDTALLRRARHCFTGKVGPWHRDGLPCRQLNPPPHRALRTLMGSCQPYNPDLRNTGELSRETLTLQGTNGFMVGHPAGASGGGSGGSAAVLLRMSCADPNGVPMYQLGPADRLSYNASVPSTVSGCAGRMCGRKETCGHSSPFPFSWSCHRGRARLFSTAR
jgi:hypothetical protein